MVWRVQVLGDARLVSGERAVTRFESRKVVALLARVALRPGRLHPREELAALLWPDADRRTGLERLRHVLSSLQRQIVAVTGGDDALAAAALPLLIDRQGVRANPAALTCDAVEFEAKVRQRSYREALALYADDLLPGYFDDWIVEERERLRALYEQAEEEAAGGHTVAEWARAVPAGASASAPPRVFLPGYLTAFFGREAEREQLKTLLETRRLVTLLGPGGGGKTRLAVETAREIAPSFDAVVFVSLADCQDPAQIPDRLRAALHLPAAPEGGDTVLAQLEVALRDTPSLLVLDNLEQMPSGGAAEVVETLLARLPTARCLATSRSLLHVPGEQSFPLAPLPLPAEGESQSETPHAANPSVALFLDRARAARPDFTLTARNRVELIALCRALEGIPLALELAASRIRAHTVGEMRRQIEEEGKRFLLVSRPDASGRRGLRHGSLHSALAWSWRLLGPHLQEFLAALSTLRGSFGADTAAAVADAPEARELLEELVASSLALAGESGEDAGERSDAMRFSLLETVREFAAEQLPPERRVPLQRAHAAFLLRTAAEPAALDRLGERDVPRLQGAVEDLIAEGMTAEALGLCVALQDFWVRVGQAETALTLLRRALALSGGTPTPRADVLTASAMFAKGGDLRLAGEFAADAVEAAGHDPTARAAARAVQCRVMYRRRDDPDETRAYANEVIGLARATGQPLLEADMVNILGLLANRRGLFGEAEAHLSAAQAQLEALGQRHRANLVRHNRGIVAVSRGDYAAAHARYRACLDDARALDDRDSEVRLWNNIGSLYAQEGRWEESIVALRECLRRAQALGSGFTLGLAFWNLAEPLARTGRPEEAVLVLAFAQRFWEERSGSFTDDDAAYRERVVREAGERLPASQSVERLWEAGSRFSLRDALGVALGS